ncbi:MAG: acetyl-CoA carboxylase biotin carboxyl carrier protein, partial [Desulfuromonadales bacterium]
DSPDAENFVKVGDVVEAGQTVCLVEAMKLFNEIEADFKCKIIEVFKEDAAPVEFGEPLFKVERL